MMGMLLILQQRQMQQIHNEVSKQNNMIMVVDIGHFA
jgi:hypothetical protein